MIILRICPSLGASLISYFNFPFNFPSLKTVNLFVMFQTTFEDSICIVQGGKLNVVPGERMNKATRSLKFQLQ